MKVTTKGQVTIPKQIRRFLGIGPHSEIDFEIRDYEVVLRKVADRDKGSGPRGRFGRLRGVKKGGPSTEEWMTATRGD